MSDTPEQEARDMLARLGMRQAQVMQMTNGDLVELANLIDDRDSLRSQVEALQRRYEGLEKVLRELVRLKDLKEKNDRGVVVGVSTWEWSQWCSDQQDYIMSKPKAWAQARAALAGETTQGREG